MSFKELAIIEATYFKAGEYPFTDQEFFANSQEQREAAPTIDPIVITMFEHEGPRVAETIDQWWNRGYTWKTARSTQNLDNYDVGLNTPELDDNYKLYDGAVRISVEPIELYISDKNDEWGVHRTLLRYEIDGMGMDAFEHCTNEIVKLCDKLRGDNNQIRLMTIWTCEAGKEPDTWDGPGEYYSDYQLTGYVVLNGMDLHIVDIEE